MELVFVILLARRIMMWFQYFLKIFVALKVTPDSVSRSSDWLVAGRLSVSLHRCLKLDQTQNQPPSLLCYMDWSKRASGTIGIGSLGRGKSARGVGRAVHLLPCCACKACNGVTFTLQGQRPSNPSTVLDRPLGIE
jgi:hypothetical protein